MENRFSGAQSQIDGFLLNPIIQSHSGIAPKTSWDTHQGTNENDSQSVPHSAASVSQSQTTGNSGPGVAYNMLTGVSEEITHGFSGKSSGKRKETHSSRQPQIHIENTLPTIEADQYLKAVRQ